jgi:hypothetical protein
MAFMGQNDQKETNSALFAWCLFLEAIASV